MDYNLRSSYDAGLCYTETSDSKTLTLAFVNPSDYSLVRDVEYELAPNPSEESLVQAISSITDGPVAMTGMTIPQEVDNDFYNTLRQSVSKAGHSIAPMTLPLASAACYSLPPLPQGDTTSILCVQLGESEKLSYAGLVNISRGEYSSRTHEISSTVIEHASNVPVRELVQGLILPLKEKTDQIILVPSAPSSVLDNFAAAILAEYPDVSILQPTRAEIAYGMGIKAAIQARRFFSSHTGTRFLVVPVGIVTANGHIVNVALAQRACPVDRTVTLQTAKDGQTTVSVPIIVGALGTDISENGNIHRIRDTVTLKGLAPPTNGRAQVRVRILVKASYDVAVLVEQAGSPNGPSIVVQCPGLLRNIKKVINEYESMYERKRVETGDKEGEIVGELSE